MAEDIQIGAVLSGTYQITALLGRGGMGAVWTASHMRLPGKRVAIKVLLDTNQNDESYARFRREAEIASRIGHPNIVEVLDWNTLPNGTPYLVLELLLGESMGVRLMQGPIALDPTIDIVRQIGSALHAAHKAGVVHRDLKPDNIFLTPTDGTGHVADRVKILDFGISKIKNSTTLQTQEQRLLGTPQYMAPEQAMGKNQLIDQRTDLFALAAIVYEMLSGRPTFGGENIAQVVFKVVYEEPEPLESLVPGLPGHVLAAIRKALAKDRDARQPDVLSFVAELTGRPLSTVDRQRTSKVEVAFAPTTDVMSQPPGAPASLAKGTTPGPSPVLVTGPPPLSMGTAPNYAPPMMTGAPALPEKRRGKGMWLALALVVAAGGGVATAIALVPKETPTATPVAAADPGAALALNPSANPNPSPIANPPPSPNPNPTASPNPPPTAVPNPNPPAVPNSTASPNPNPPAAPNPTASPNPNPTAVPSPIASPNPNPTAVPHPVPNPNPSPTANPPSNPPPPETPKPPTPVHTPTPTHTTRSPSTSPPPPTPTPTPPAEDTGENEPADVASELRDAEHALASKRYDEAIRIARHSMQSKITPHAYGVMARGYCGLRDLSNAKAALQHLHRPAHAFVVGQCRRLGFPIDD